jgi:hypothetical protein
MTSERNYDQNTCSKMGSCIEGGCYLVHAMNKHLSSVFCTNTSLLFCIRSEGPWQQIIQLLRRSSRVMIPCQKFCVRGYNAVKSVEKQPKFRRNFCLRLQDRRLSQARSQHSPILTQTSALKNRGDTILRNVGSSSMAYRRQNSP